MPLCFIQNHDVAVQHFQSYSFRIGNLDERGVWQLNLFKVRPEKLGFDLHYKRKSV